MRHRPFTRRITSDVGPCAVTESRPLTRRASTYVAISKRLACDLPRLGALRRELRTRLSASPLCDGAAFAGDLLDVLRKAWQRWCASSRDAVDEASIAMQRP